MKTTLTLFTSGESLAKPDYWPEEIIQFLNGLGSVFLSREEVRKVNKYSMGISTRFQPLDFSLSGSRWGPLLSAVGAKGERRREGLKEWSTSTS